METGSEGILFYALLCDNEVKAVQRVINVVLVSEADAFDQHRKTQVIVTVAAPALLLLLLLILVFGQLSDCSVYSV